MDKGSVITRPIQKFSNAPAAPVLSTVYLQDSMEGIDRKILKDENDLRILLDEEGGEKTNTGNERKLILDFNVNITRCYNLLKKF